MIAEDSREDGRRARVAYAGFWRRLVAMALDIFLLGVVQTAIFVAVLEVQPGDWGAVRNVVIVSSLCAWAYFALMESSPLGATAGKLAAGIWVADLNGDPISFTRASLRYWLKSLSGLSLAIGYLIAAFTPRKQALHDLMAGTLVLRTTRARDAGTAGTGRPPEEWNGTAWVGSATRTEVS